MPALVGNECKLFASGGMLGIYYPPRSSFTVNPTITCIHNSHFIIIAKPCRDPSCWTKAPAVNTTDTTTNTTKARASSEANADQPAALSRVATARARPASEGNIAASTSSELGAEVTASGSSSRQRRWSDQRAL
jgi:hypothetical protein